MTSCLVVPTEKTMIGKSCSFMLIALYFLTIYDSKILLLLCWRERSEQRSFEKKLIRYEFINWSSLSSKNTLDVIVHAEKSNRSSFYCYFSFQSRKHYVHKALCVASTCFLYMLLPLVKKRSLIWRWLKTKGNGGNNADILAALAIIPIADRMRWPAARKRSALLCQNHHRGAGATPPNSNYSSHNGKLIRCEVESKHCPHMRALKSLMLLFLLLLLLLG